MLADGLHLTWWCGQRGVPPACGLAGRHTPLHIAGCASPSAPLAVRGQPRRAERTCAPACTRSRRAASQCGACSSCFDRHGKAGRAVQGRGGCLEALLLHGNLSSITCHAEACCEAGAAEEPTIAVGLLRPHSVAVPVLLAGGVGRRAVRRCSGWRVAAARRAGRARQVGALHACMRCARVIHACKFGYACQQKVELPAMHFLSMLHACVSKGCAQKYGKAMHPVWHPCAGKARASHALLLGLHGLNVTSRVVARETASCMWLTLPPGCVCGAWGTRALGVSHPACKPACAALR